MLLRASIPPSYPSIYALELPSLSYFIRLKMVLAYLQLNTQINECVLQTAARDGTGGHRFIVLPMDRRRRLPLPIPIVTTISEAYTGEILWHSETTKVCAQRITSSWGRYLAVAG